MTLYDLRFLSRSTPHGSKETQPLLIFDAYRNREAPGYATGFSVHKTANLIAVTCDRPCKQLLNSACELLPEICLPPGAKDPGVRLFDALTGQIVPTHITESPILRTHRSKDVNNKRKDTARLARCLQFIERDQGPGLLVGSEAGLQEWRW